MTEELRAGLSPEHVAAVAAALGSRVVAERPTTGGFSTAVRTVVTTADGRTAFVKAATDTDTARWLRAERRVYAGVDAPFLPRMLAWVSDPGPVLVLEDLSAEAAPPPWTPEHVAAVRRSLDAVAQVAVPEGTPRMPDDVSLFRGWRAIAADPERFYALGWRDAAWGARALHRLVAAEASASPAGDGLCHLDVRSDNLRIRDGWAVLFDWNWAQVANPALDLAFWLPSLAMEGGPPPIDLVDDGPLAAMVSGFFCRQGSLPEEGMPPGVRSFQQAQGRHALAWVEQCLGLSET